VPGQLHPTVMAAVFKLAGAGRVHDDDTRVGGIGGDGDLIVHIIPKVVLNLSFQRLVYAVQAVSPFLIECWGLGNFKPNSVATA